ncbi:MAG: hypothetical protein ABIQ47_01850 [Tepidiformaceae bacterium]
MPKPGAADLAKREKFGKDHGKEITPPKATASGAGFEVVAFQVVEQAVQRATVHVARDGKVKAQFASVAASLRLVAGH